MNPASGLRISANVIIPLGEIEITAIRSQGAGGQNINKVATGIHLRFDIRASSLPDYYKHRLISLRDQRITADGIIVIKAQSSRSQDKNREDALNRLTELIRNAGVIQKKRRATKPTRSSQKKRLEQKSQRGKVKSLRRKVTD